MLKFTLSILIRCCCRKYFKHHFLIIIFYFIFLKLPADGTPETHTLRKQRVAEYFKVWSQSTTPINQKRSNRNLFFYLSSNSLVSFLSQTSNLVHSSLHLVTWIYQSQPVSVVGLLPTELNVLFISVLLQICLCFDCIILRGKMEKHKCFILISLLLSFSELQQEK